MKSLYVDFDEDKIISNLEDVVPLFPLGNMVFFPNTVIPPSYIRRKIQANDR
ncbi:hypothetical protein CM15mP43_01080 [bacterium]|nr:MAG: hypothetical protein CM15mP43_01080 [bacterium]